MQYGLIGEHLEHSFSKEIHISLGEYQYELKELAPSQLASFMHARDFEGINVTIPYKQDVIPYLDVIDEQAQAIGAVNTVVNRDGKLFGFNTDFFGMQALFAHAGISAEGKKVAILGTGGTSNTAKSVLESLGAAKILKVSRNPKEGAITYLDLYQDHSDCQIIVNTTPIGMYPKTDCKPIDVSKFAELCGVIDVIYNPLVTELVKDARKLGIPAEGGLYMLVAQAVRASEIFLDCEYDSKIVETCYKNLLSNPVISSGKTASTAGSFGVEKSRKSQRTGYDVNR